MVNEELKMGKGKIGKWSCRAGPACNDSAAGWQQLGERLQSSAGAAAFEAGPVSTRWRTSGVTLVAMDES